MYVFDTSIFYVLRIFSPERFPTIWQRIEDLLSTNELTSTREVLRELERHSPGGYVGNWIATHSTVFPIPTREELLWVRKIFETRGNVGLVKRKNILNGWPVADPFVIACAKVNRALIVTQEDSAKPGARIPYVAKQLGVRSVDFTGFLAREGLKY